MNYPPAQAHTGYTSSTEYPPDLASQGHQPNSTSVIVYYRKRRRWVHWPSLVLLIAIWIFLMLTCVVQLFATHIGRRQTSKGGEYMTSDEIANSLALSTLLGLLATILNEVLVERCWQIIQCLALKHDEETMAENLRSASFGWWGFTKRLFCCKLSRRDLRMFGSWLWLRSGTAIAIASTQLSVSWSPAQDGTTRAYSCRSTRPTRGSI